jgi:ribonuclease PH
MEHERKPVLKKGISSQEISQQTGRALNEMVQLNQMHKQNLLFLEV